MKYRESTKDKSLRKSFSNNFTQSFLRHIYLEEGSLRGINFLEIHFNYPITAIAGRNGSGKSTILALACCAYHNARNAFKLAKRKTTYYTFSDFFIQHTEEVPPQGIDIRYGFATNRLRKTPENPDGTGIGYQRRWKSKGGKWNNYEDRLRKNVVFLGIERIVPHAERSQSRSYSKAFKAAQPKGWEDKVKEAVAYILGKNYDIFRYLEHSKYSLPMVQVGDTIYTGFNMGAGENALFEIFSTIYACGEGSLLVMDEIELGLHAEAQRKFIERLKDVCLETNTQVICTTHSKEIFDCPPYDARIFIECINGKTKITDAISSEFAFAKLAAQAGRELDIFVEDDVAKSLIQSALPTAIRTRVKITIIGSATALARQLAALYVRGEERPAIAIFDGDQRTKENKNLIHAQKMAEKVDEGFSEWFKSHIAYLPGETWPESWIVQKGLQCLDDLQNLLSSDVDTLTEVFEYGLQAGKHCEFFEISKNLGLEKSNCLQLVTLIVSKKFANDLTPLVSKIADTIDKHS